MTGPFQLEAFERALHSIFERHEALRTLFHWSDGDRTSAEQSIVSIPIVELEKREISRDTDAQEALEALQSYSFNLDHGQAIRVQLLSLSDEVHYFLLGCHHIALDGHSIFIFFRELAQAYTDEPFQPLPYESQYRTFARQQRESHEAGHFTQSINYFKRNLLPADTPPIDLLPFAGVTSRTPMTNYGQHVATLVLDSQLVTKVKELASRLCCTSFHVYFTVLQLLVFRLLPETNEIVFGIADANRSHPNFFNTIGCMINLLAIKFARNDKGKFSHAVRATRDRVNTTLSHSQVPFDVLLNELGAATGYDVHLEVTETVAGQSMIAMKLQQSIYSLANSELLLRSYVHLLEQFIQSPIGNVPVCAPSLWTEMDISNAIQIGTDSSMELTWPCTICHRVDEIVLAYPNSLAIKDGHGNILSYSQMSHRINAISGRLIECGVQHGTRVAVFQEPSSDWICSMFAIFRTGATYLPLDPKNGTHRLRGCVRVGRPAVILADSWTSASVSRLQAEDIQVIDVSEIQAGSHCDLLPNVATRDAIAVILFTSGSTGTPKGIMLPHSCLVSHAEGVEKAWNVGRNRVLQQITMSFDFSLHQIFTALANGGLLYVVPSRQRGDPAEITKIMLKEDITHTLATPTEYRVWFQMGVDALHKCSAWKWALVGGEALPKSVIQSFARLGLSNLALCDFYGPVEATIAITKGNVDYEEANTNHAIPTGHILPNYSVFILDSNMQPVPIGVSGEVVVGGPCIAQGYLELENLTNEKFIKKPATMARFVRAQEERLYRTGDYGRLREDGALLYQGRINGDTQVKLHGIRVELEEIETNVVNASNGSILQAVAVLRGDESKEKVLVAYVNLKPGLETNDKARENLWTTLRSTIAIPQYMMPSVFIPIDSIPINAHGKTDRKLLANLILPTRTTPCPAQADSEAQTSFTYAEHQLQSLWRAVLPSQVLDLTKDSDFFQLGGNSLLIIHLQRLAQRHLNTYVPLVDLIRCSSLHSMADLMVKSKVDDGQNDIDWEDEIKIPSSWLALQTSLVKATTPATDLTIVLTGATGYIGRNLLQLLADSPVVSKKISSVICNLREPSLGLSHDVFSQISAEADVILHCAADRSFWDGYEVLRQVNVNSVKELARLAIPRGATFHFFSSGAAADCRGSANGSAAVDGPNGYVQSKWAAEKFLYNVAERFNLPVYLHTPSETRPQDVDAGALAQGLTA
ncbi:hypothetical protein V2A60_002587 [Cordyceps javanica]